MTRVREPCTRVGVTVTFLRMDQRPFAVGPQLPDNAQVVQDRSGSVQAYRSYYNTVGADYVWWLRRVLPDHQLAALLRDPRVSVHVLLVDGQEAGFYELDRTPWPAVNISYFGLFPSAVGRGLGSAFLRHCVDAAWDMRPRHVTVNTCTADHPRALPHYLRAGFKPVRQVFEEWDVPQRLGLAIPPGLRI